MLKQLDFGIKYFTNPGSFYNDKDGNNSALPALMSDKLSGEDEMESLIARGFRPLI
jgi:hypothetical protein